MTLHLVERDSAGPTQRILVLLPGYGDEPATFVDHLDTIDRDRRWHVAVARPPLATPDGPAWFTVGEEGPDADQLTDAVDAVAATLADLLDRFALAPDALVVGGFSQGGAMALAAGLDPSLAARPGAVAALGAYLPHRGTSQDQALFAGRPVLVAHGADDEVVDALLGRSAAKTLHRTGAIVTWVEVDAGHTLDGPLLGALRDWLVELAAGRAPSAPPA